MTVHIIGAGLAGLSAALTVAESGRPVIVHEGAGHAGGRARSWVEPTLDRLVDNGTHMVVGANRAVFDFLKRTGSIDGLIAGPMEFPLLDLVSGRRWSANRLGTMLSVVGALATLGRCGPDSTIADCVAGSTHYRHFWDPLAIAVMNTPPDAASAAVFRRVAGRTIWRSRAASRPFLARHGLSQTFVRPALERLATLGVTLKFNHPLRHLTRTADGIERLHFDEAEVGIGAADSVILAVPWSAAQRFLPHLPDLPASPIINGHFRLAEEPVRLRDGDFLGLLGGTGQWLFRRGDVVSVTISAAAAHIDQTSEDLAALLWHDIADALALRSAPLASRIVKEKRATLFHTPAVERLRPSAMVGVNLFLAGDWTATGIPCTLEGAIVSGTTAGQHAVAHAA